MIFRGPYLGPLFGCIIFVLGHLTSSGLASSEVFIYCEEFEEPRQSSNVTTMQKFIYIDLAYWDLNCEDILYEGRYYRYPNGVFRFGLFKEELIGLSCSYTGNIEYICDDMYMVKADRFGIHCETWTEPINDKAVKLNEIQESPEALPVGKLSWDMAMTKSVNLDCQMKNFLASFDRYESPYEYPFVNLTLISDFSPVPECSLLIDEPIVIIFNSYDDLKNLTVRLQLRKHSNYICTMTNILTRLQGNSSETFFLKMNDLFIYCEEKYIEEYSNIETNLMKQKELIKCYFTNFRKGINNKFIYSGSTKRTFIYIDHNENREKLDCSILIKGGNVKNYGNNLLEFTLYKKEVNNFECDVNENTIIKRYHDSQTVLTNFAVLICREYRDAPLLNSLINKTIECEFNTKSIIRELICKKRRSLSKTLLSVWTNDENLKCSSIIVDGKLQINEYNKVRFGLYKPGFSGYRCDLELDEIEGLKSDWLMVKRKNKILKCKKYTKIKKLACPIMGISPFYRELWPLVKIEVETIKSVQCSDILLSGSANLTDLKTGKYSEAIIKILHERQSGFICSFYSEAIDLFEIREHYYKLKLNLEKELKCIDFSLSTPERISRIRGRRNIRFTASNTIVIENKEDRIQRQNNTEEVKKYIGNTEFEQNEGIDDGLDVLIDIVWNVAVDDGRNEGADDDLKQSVEDYRRESVDNAPDEEVDNGRNEIVDEGVIETFDEDRVDAANNGVV